MATWERCERGLRLVGVDRPSLEIETDGWESCADAPPPTCPGDQSVGGRTRSLRLSATDVTIETATGSWRRRWDGTPTTLPSNRYEIRVGGRPTVACRFDGCGTLRRDDSAELELDFDTPRSLTITAMSIGGPSGRRLEVRPRLSEVAHALSAINTCQEPRGPDRSWPSLRPRPPAIVLHEGADHRRDPHESPGVSLGVPADIGSLLVCAPLAFYLGIPLTIEERERPRLRAVDGWKHQFSRPPALESDVAQWLRACVFLDSLVRVAGPFTAPHESRDRLAEHGLDAAELYRASLSERLRAYRAADLEAVLERAPEWPLATYLPARLESVRALPYVLDRLSSVGLPRSARLGDAERLERSLDAFFRDASRHAVDFRKPTLLAARYHAWLGEGVPVDVFLADPETLSEPAPAMSAREVRDELVVVVNDPDMATDREIGAGRPPGRSLPDRVETTVLRILDRDDLRDVFSRNVRFVHFIGHCEPDGLQCSDGLLACESIENARVETFFLNACGSYHEGRALIEAGSCAGAVTCAPVVDRQAGRVGRTFVRLLWAGFGFERALGLARRRIIMGTDYVVVGDGTHRLARHRTTPPTVAIATPRPDASVDVVLDTTRMRNPGELVAVGHTDSPGYRLIGAQPTDRLSAEAFREFLEDRRDPVLYDGVLYWPEELTARLDATGTLA